MNRAPGSEKGRRTQSRLLDSAEKVFTEKGYLATRVADIADAAGLAHGSFYTYFESKDDIFRQVSNRAADEVYVALTTGATGSALDRIRVGNRRYLELYERRSRVLALIEQVATFNEDLRELRLGLRRRFVDRIQRAIGRVQDAQPEASRLDARIAANALGGMVDNFSFASYALGERIDLTEALRTLDEIWIRALQLDEGRGEQEEAYGH